MPGKISSFYMIREFNYKTPDQAVAAIIHQAEKDKNWIRPLVDGSNIDSMFQSLKSKVNYTDDPRGVELIQRPRTLFSRLNELGAPGNGDCDDFTTAAVCAAMAYNYPVRVVLAGRSIKNPVHVYAEIYDESLKHWRKFDLTAPDVDTVRKYPYLERIEIKYLDQ